MRGRKWKNKETHRRTETHKVHNNWDSDPKEKRQQQKETQTKLRMLYRKEETSCKWKRRQETKKEWRENTMKSRDNTREMRVEESHGDIKNKKKEKKERRKK